MLKFRYSSIHCPDERWMDNSSVKPYPDRLLQEQVSAHQGRSKTVAGDMQVLVYERSKESN